MDGLQMGVALGGGLGTDKGTVHCRCPCGHGPQNRNAGSSITRTTPSIGWPPFVRTTKMEAKFTTVDVAGGIAVFEIMKQSLWIAKVLDGLPYRLFRSVSIGVNSCRFFFLL